MTACPSCNAPAVESDAFCGGCGAKIVSPTIVPSPTQASAAPDAARSAAKSSAATPPKSLVAATIEEAPRSLRTLSYLVMAAAAVSATAVIPGLLALRYQGDTYLAARQSVDDLVGIAALLWYPGFIVGAILFMALLNRLRHNLNRLNVTGQRYGADQAIWPWFIPIFNLFRPVRFVSDLYRGLHGRGEHPGREMFVTRRAAETSPVIAAWWTTWVLQGIASRLIDVSGEPLATLFGCLIWGAGGALTVVLVYQLLQLNQKAIAAFDTPTATI